MTRRELQFMATVMAVAVAISMSVAIRSIWVMEEAASADQLQQRDLAVNATSGLREMRGPMQTAFIRYTYDYTVAGIQQAWGRKS